MKRLLWHLSIPALVATWAVLSALRFEPFSLEMLAASGLFGFLYYSAPHFVWAAVNATKRLSRFISHAGFIAASFALIAVSLLPLAGMRDPSGLPYHWLLYWPLALVLQLVFVAVAALIRRESPRVDA